MLKHILLNIFLGLILVTAATLAQSAIGQDLSDLEADPLDYVEGDESVQVTNQVSVSGNASISYAVVSFSEGYQAGEDTLVYDGDASVYPIFNDETGELLLLSYPAGTLSSGGEIQTALRSVFYLNTNEGNPSVTQRTISFTTYQLDSTASNTVSRTIAVQGVNNPPVLRSPTNAPVVVNSLLNRVLVAEDLLLVDEDNEIMVGATVSLSREREFSRFGDRLVFADDTRDNITIQTEQDDDRTLILSGRDSKVNYQLALRSIGIQNFFTTIRGNRLVIMQVADESEEASNEFRQYVHVTDPSAPLNIPPSAEDIAVSTIANQSVTFQAEQFGQAYRDPEQPTLSAIFIQSLPEKGTLTLNGEVIDADYLVQNQGEVNNTELNQLVYTPNQEYVGSDQFQWIATDDGSIEMANPARVLISVSEAAIPLSLSLPASTQVDEDGLTMLPPLEFQSAPSTSVGATLTVESGDLSINPIVLSFVTVSGENTSELTISGSAQVMRYALSGVQYRPAPNMIGSDLLSVSIVSTAEQAAGTLEITIIPIDDPVLLSGIEPDTLLYVEDSPPVPITSQLILSDPDGGVAIKSAKISITEGWNEKEDQLAYELAGSITATFNESQLDLVGEGSLEQYQLVLRSVTYQNTSDNPQTDSLIFNYQVTDNNDSVSNTVFRALQVIPIDDSTRLTSAEPELLSYVLRSESVPMYSSLVVSDIDSDSLTRMIVFFETGYNPTLDSVLVSIPEGMEVFWDEGTGSLEVVGKNSLAVYQMIARSLRYQSTATTVQTNRRIAIQVFNDETPSDQLFRTIQFIENEPPVITGFSKKVVQNGASGFTSGEFLSNYTDSDNLPTPDQFSSLRIISLPTQGVLTVASDTITQSDIDESPDGFFLSIENIEQLLYRPNADYLGEDQWAWNAFDGAELAEDSALVSFTVVPALSSNLPDTVICPGETLELTVEVLSGETPYTFSWFCDREDCQIQSGQNEAVVAVSPVETTQYIVQITSSQGLDSIQDTVFVQAIDCSDVPLEIPSAFTPNGDGFNDYWELPNAGIFSSVQVAVYDRFGKSIFESPNYQNDWDGTYRGKELPAGSYYYSIVVPRELQEYTGTVTLLR